MFFRPGALPGDRSLGAVQSERAGSGEQEDGRTVLERDGSIRIAWSAEGFEAIHVRARFRTAEEHASWARGIADEALLERTVRGLHARLRARYPGAFDLTTRERIGESGSVIVTFHPPKGTPRPDD